MRKKSAWRGNWYVVKITKMSTNKQLVRILYKYLHNQQLFLLPYKHMLCFQKSRQLCGPLKSLYWVSGVSNCLFNVYINTSQMQFQRDNLANKICFNFHTLKAHFWICFNFWHKDSFNMSTFIISKLGPGIGTSSISISKYSKSLHFKVWSMN